MTNTRVQDGNQKYNVRKSPTKPNDQRLSIPMDPNPDCPKRNSVERHESDNRTVPTVLRLERIKNDHIP